MGGMLEGDGEGYLNERLANLSECKVQLLRQFRQPIYQQKKSALLLWLARNTRQKRQHRGLQIAQPHFPVGEQGNLSANILVNIKSLSISSAEALVYMMRRRSFIQISPVRLSNAGIKAHTALATVWENFC